MARPPRPKKRERGDAAAGQLPLPGPPTTPAPPAATRLLPMQLQVGDRLADATGEWDVVGYPYTTNAGKNVHVRVRRVDQPDVSQIRSWSAHERITVRRA